MIHEYFDTAPVITTQAVVDLLARYADTPSYEEALNALRKITARRLIGNRTRNRQRLLFSTVADDPTYINIETSTDLDALDMVERRLVMLIKKHYNDLKRSRQRRHFIATGQLSMFDDLDLFREIVS